MRQAVLFLAVFFIFFIQDSFALGAKDKTVNINYNEQNQPSKKIEQKSAKGETLTINFNGFPQLTVGKGDDNKPPRIIDEEDKRRDPALVSVGDRLNVNSDFANITDRTPITNAKYYLSKNFTLRIDDQKSSSEIFIEDDRKVVIKQNDKKPNEIEFGKDIEGKFNDSDKNRYFDILFKMNESQPILRFTRNSQTDYFILSSVKINDKDHSIPVEGEPILLQVYGKDERNHVISAGSKNTSENKNLDNDFRDQQPGNNGKTSRNTYIISSGKSNPSNIIRYIKTKNKNPALNEANIERLISLYINEATLEDVNHDIAIAQMLHITDFLKSEKIIKSNNYGGLNKEEAKWNYKSWDGQFESMQVGVRAHIQHLRYYSKQGLKNNNTENVDPRKHQLEEISGNIQTFNQLYSVWSPHYPERYKKSIENILEDLYNYSSK